METKRAIFHPSISEQNGLALLQDDDLNVLSVGISTGGAAEIQMLELEKPRQTDRQRHIIATTIDEKGLADTKKIIEELGLSDRIEAKLEDVSKPMPYADGYFDFIYARLVLHYLNDNEMKCALAELHRVLKDGGRMFVVVKSVKDYTNSLPGAEFNPETGFTKTPIPKTIGTDSVRWRNRRLHTKETIENFLNQAGFDVVDCTKEYNEQLFHDYMRTEVAEHPATVLETVVRKIR